MGTASYCHKCFKTNQWGKIERFPNYPSTHHIFDVRLISLVYLAKKYINSGSMSAFFFFSSKSNLRSSASASVEWRGQQTAGQEQEQMGTGSSKGTIAHSCAQRLHFSVPSISEHTKILNSIGLSPSKQLHYSFTGFPVATKKLTQKQS